MSMVTPINFAHYVDANGILSVYESGASVPFDIRRVFTVSAKAGDLRGDHAHKKCVQLLICVSGSIRVICDDGRTKQDYILDHLGKGLLIPAGIWAREEYLANDAVLMVLCDQAYDASDYIRDYSDYRKFIASKGLQ